MHTKNNFDIQWIVLIFETFKNKQIYVMSTALLENKVELINEQQVAVRLGFKPEKIREYLDNNPQFLPKVNKWGSNGEAYWAPGRVDRWLKKNGEPVLLTSVTVAEMLNISPVSLTNAAHLYQHRVPLPVNKGARRLLWNKVEVDWWIEKKEKIKKTLIDPQELARVSGLSLKTIRLYCSARPYKLPPVHLRAGRLGRTPYWQKADVEAWLKERKLKKPVILEEGEPYELPWKVPGKYSGWKKIDVSEKELIKYINDIQKKYSFPDLIIETRQQFVWNLLKIIDNHEYSYSDIILFLDKRCKISVNKSTLSRLAHNVPNKTLNLEILSGILALYNCDLRDIIFLEGSDPAKTNKSQARVSCKNKLKWGLPVLMKKHKISPGQLSMSLMKYGLKYPVSSIEKLSGKQQVVKRINVELLVPLIHFFNCQLEDILVVR